MTHAADTQINLLIGALPGQVESVLREAGLSTADFDALNSLLKRHRLTVQLSFPSGESKSIEPELSRLSDDVAAPLLPNNSIMKEHAGHNIYSMDELLPEVKACLTELPKNPSVVTGIATGFHALDEHIVGVHPGELIVVAGCPSVGKTTLALNVIEHVAIRLGLPVMFFSMTLGATQVATRIVSSSAGVIQQHIRTGRLTALDWDRLNKAMANLANSPIHVDATAAFSIGDLCMRARRLWQRYMGLELIVIDNLQLLAASQASVVSSSDVREIAGALKALAKELRVAIVLIADLHRPPDEREPKRSALADLREYIVIEQYADVVLLLCRGNESGQESSARAQAEIVIAKQRNGPTGIVKVAFNSAYARFENGRKPWTG